MKRDHPIIADKDTERQLKDSKIELDRKILSDLAEKNPEILALSSQVEKTRDELKLAKREYFSGVQG